MAHLRLPGDIESLLADLRRLVGLPDEDLPPRAPALASDQDLRELARGLLHDVLGLEVDLG